jgi:putative transcription factor
MEDCELCGRQTKSVYVLNIENVEMRTCVRCAEGKKVVRVESDAPREAQKPRTTRPGPQEEEELIDGYGAVVRSARERMKIPLPVLAEMLNEKEHQLLRVEEERTRPTIALTKKLEKVLKIKLTEAAPEVKHVANKKGSDITIGDLIDMK